MPYDSCPILGSYSDDIFCLEHILLMRTDVTDDPYFWIWHYSNGKLYFQIDDLDFLKQIGVDPEKVASALVEMFAEMIFVHGYNGFSLGEQYIYLEAETLPSAMDTSTPQPQPDRASLWLGFKSLLGFMDSPTFEEGLLERCPFFLDIVLNHIRS
ncbi:hypothetical protein K1719_028284 [Acacia pycnantha]|nr:hypothetical protein K1719_028284 [Acacia pycnantha]